MSHQLNLPKIPKKDLFLNARYLTSTACDPTVVFPLVDIGQDGCRCQPYW